MATEEEYIRKLERAKGEVIKNMHLLTEIMKSDYCSRRYYEQQSSIAKAIKEEGRAEAKGIKKMNEALAAQGGKVMVKLKMAEALKGKKIFLMPSGSGGSIDLKTLDVNKFLELEGIQSAAKSSISSE